MVQDLEQKFISTRLSKRIIDVIEDDNTVVKGDMVRERAVSIISFGIDFKRTRRA